MQMRGISLAVLLSAAMFHQATSTSRVLFDFERLADLGGWHESSDTVREVGMSKATLVLQKTRIFQRAVFFSLLNPQPNGAGFAGYRTQTQLDLRGSRAFRVLCRGQGENSHYKIVLRHHGRHADGDVEYEQFFDAPMSRSEFGSVELPLDGFRPYFRGRLVPDAEPLDLGDVTMFGIQIYGGVYSEIKQKGASALEITKIEAVD